MILFRFNLGLLGSFGDVPSVGEAVEIEGSRILNISIFNADAIADGWGTKQRQQGQVTADQTMGLYLHIPSEKFTCHMRTQLRPHHPPMGSSQSLL